MKNLLLNLLALLIAASLSGQAYEVAHFDMTVSGTSTLHDWTSDITKINAEAYIDWENGKVGNIRNLSVTVPVGGIVSTKGRIMDGKTWDALKMDKYPNITFKVGTADVKWVDGKYLITANGKLTVAGQTKTVTLKANGKPVANGGLVFSGSYDINMPDYGVEPPTALMGSIKTGEKVTIDYSVNMVPSNGNASLDR
ncbi:MAG: YceI family protein [bacterium]|nr:YceI family protein [bacterium]